MTFIRNSSIARSQTGVQTPFRSRSSGSYGLAFSSNSFQSNLWPSHTAINPDGPNAIYEFQGGASDFFGSVGFDVCARLIGPEFARGSVFP
jgi:hypothetical protein